MAVPAQASLTLSPQTLPALKVPEAYGHVAEMYQGPSDQVVLLLQDAHSQAEAQKHLGALIHYFQTKFAVGFVGLEGAAGALDAQIFKSFPDQKLLRRVLKSYQSKGELAGGGMAAIFYGKDPKSGPVFFQGIEDWDLYQQGTAYYLEARKQQDRITEKLEALETELALKKRSAYSEKLLQADASLERFYSQKESFAETLKTLSAIERPQPGSEVDLVLREILNPETLDSDAEAGLLKAARLVSKAVANHPDARLYAAFHQKYQAFITSQATPENFAVFLQKQARQLKLPLMLPPEILRRAAAQQKLQAVEGTRLFASMEMYAAAVKNSLIHGAVQKNLDKATARLRALKAMNRLAMTEKVWQALVQTPKDEWTAPEKEILNLMQAHRHFYETAAKREEVFFENVTAGMRRLKQKTALAVVGGFHAQGLLERLRK